MLSGSYDVAHTVKVDGNLTSNHKGCQLIKRDSILNVHVLDNRASMSVINWRNAIRNRRAQNTVRHFNILSVSE